MNRLSSKGKRVVFNTNYIDFLVQRIVRVQYRELSDQFDMLFGDFSKYDNTVAYRNLVLSLVPPNIALYEYVKAFPEVPPGFIRDMECYISKHTCIEKFEHINRRISKVANQMISLGEDFLNSSELKRLVRKKQEAIDTMTKEVDYKKSLMLDRVKWDTVQITGRKVTIDPCRLNIIVPYDSFPLIRVYRVIGKDMGRIEEAFVACM